jgi:hypothetical protein
MNFLLFILLDLFENAGGEGALEAGRWKRPAGILLPFCFSHFAVGHLPVVIFRSVLSPPNLRAGGVRFIFPFSFSSPQGGAGEAGRRFRFSHVSQKPDGRCRPSLEN